MSKDNNRSRSGAISLISSVVARSKSKRQHTDAEDRTRASSFRSGMQAALLRARVVAKGDQAESFFCSAKRIALFESNRFERQPVGYDYLVQLQEPSRLPLEEEIIWLSHRVNSYSAEISKFIEDRQEIESLFASGLFSDSLDALNDHIERNGASLWSVSLKVGLLQIVNGLDAQKAFVSEIRGTYKHAILPYLANSYSQRAEDEISIGYYLENAKRRLDRVKSLDIRTYLQFKVEEKWPSSYAGISTILRIEQNHHEIDIYETYLSVLQHLVITNASGRVKKAVREAVNRLRHIQDFRLAKVLVTVDSLKDLSQFGKLNSRSAAELFSGRVRDAFLRSLDSYRDSPGSLPAILIGAIAKSQAPHSGRRRRRISGKAATPRRLFTQLVESLVPVVRRGDIRAESESDYNAWSAKKLGYVLSGMTLFQGIRCLTDAEEENTFNQFSACLRKAALVSKELSILDAFGRNGVECIASSGDNALQEFVDRFHGRWRKPASQEVGSLLRTDVAAYADACFNLISGEIEAVEANVSEALVSPSRALASHAASVALEAYAESGQIGPAAKLIASEHVNGGTSIEALPVGAVFEGVDWSQLEEHASTISLSIALYIFAQIGNEDTTHSYRCFALETFLQAKGVTRPSELKLQASDFDAAQLGFFLGRVCEWSLLDMLPPIKSTRDVLEERRDICALILQMVGVTSTETYRQELLAVTKELMVQQGLQTIDGSRVHVDIDALRISLRRELAESHSRYMSLVKQGIGVSEDFDTVLRDIAKQEGQPKYLLSIPQNEADELLYEMIRQVRERFLFDIPHGLDSYLSKRIRHGSIVGYLRGAAEKEGIISAQNLDGSYKPSPKWNAVISSSLNGAELEGIFQGFAKAFDSYLIRLKDVQLHVKSDQRPLGIFDAPLGPPLFHVIRSVTARDVSLQSFVDTLLASLWGLLNPSLAAARDLLLKDTARALAEMFDGLRMQINKLIPLYHDRVELDMAAGRASAQVQAAVQTVAAWFNPAEGDDCDYSIDEVVEIALASVRAIAVSFNPSLSVHEDRPHRIARGVMLLIVDALFIAFHNIARWSNSETPDVRVNVSTDPDAAVIRIRIVNSVVAKEDFESCQGKIRNLKEKLFTPEGAEMTRREGGSGLFKLASITSQATSGRLNFGFLSPTEFFLELDLSLPSLDDSF